ncbi:hypothetical protein [Streptomyces sp. UNOC14_S4]|uniref:hypothetical protein n=1 Tax=Streptomyces sp. UNOC14_S4 TaxID=2872340 RepID=UPI001E5417CE|nr:hypothetical protein [Streptomyces sp. UNOC14_S4]MCC3767925.1 hypothetical protein [Streptomyces sp. UNOC14_S4]
MASETFVRCAAGHLYTATWIPFVGIRSLKVGGIGRRYAKCPVAGHWGMVAKVAAGELGKAEIAEARLHRVGIQ